MTSHNIPGTYWLSADGENFTNGPYRTKELAIESAGHELDLRPGDSFQVGRRVNFVPKINIEPIITQVRNDAMEECGDEHGGRFLDRITEAQENDLHKFLSNQFQKWLEDNHLEPNFFSIEDSTTETVPESTDREY